MTARTVALLALVVVVLWMMAGRTGGATAPEAPVAPNPAVEDSSTGAAAARAERNQAEFLRRIDESDTYIPAMLAAADSTLVRWPERIDQPLRVFVEPGRVPGYDQRKQRAVLDAFRRWELVAEIPVDFVFIRSPDGADVVVQWIESFEAERAGQAKIVWRSDGWVQSGTLTLATYTPGPGGRELTRDAVFTVALHEIGHLLGLGHSDDPRDVMAPTTTVHDLTGRDRRTAMLLYGLRPGRIGGS